MAAGYNGAGERGALRHPFQPFEASGPVTVRYSMVVGSGEGASLRRRRR